MLMMIAKIGKVFWTSRNCRKLAEHLLMNFLHEILMINMMVMKARRIYRSMLLRRMRIEWMMVRMGMEWMMKIVIMIRIRMMRMLAMMVCGSTRDNDY